MALNEDFVKSWKYNLGVQQATQVLCCAIFASLCCLLLVNDQVAGFETEPIWSTATFALSVGGIVTACFGVIGVRFHIRSLLFVNLGYVVLFLTFRVMYTAFPLSKETKNMYFGIQIAISSVIVLVNWVQLYFALYYFRLLRFHDVYYRHPKGRQQKVAVEDLVTLMQTLGQKPTPSQVVELLSYISADATTFTFKEFCQMEFHLLKMRQLQVRRQRRVSRSREPLLAERRGRPDGETGSKFSFSQQFEDEDWETNTRVLVRDSDSGAWMPLAAGDDAAAQQRSVRIDGSDGSKLVHGAKRCA